MAKRIIDSELAARTLAWVRTHEWGRNAELSEDGQRLTGLSMVYFYADNMMEEKTHSIIAHPKAARAFGGY